MFRQSSSRNQRSKGFRTKHGLQVFLLMAVCVWLLYQVKHSHDKRQTLDESGAGISEKVEDAMHDVFNLGRKDISERIHMTTDKQKEDGEEDEGKREVREEEEEEEGKHEENEEEERGVGDDEIDERDQEKIDEDAEQEEDLVDGEDEKENDAEKDNQFDDTDASETQKHNNDDAGADDGDSSSSHGLIHDTQIIRSDIAKLEQESATREQGEGSNERDPDKDTDAIDATLLQTKSKEAAMEEIEPSRNSSDLPRVLREREPVGDASHNLTANGEVGGVKLSEVQDEFHLNSTVGELKEQIELHNNSTPETAETPVSMVGDQNITFSRTQDHETTKSEFQGHNTTLYEVQNQNRTLIEEQEEKIDTDSGGGESDEHLEALELDESDDEDSLATQEERDALTDLATLPEHEDEEANNEAVSAE